MDHHPRRTESGTFSIDELFFSTTDPKGVITSCNGVFERVAGYTDAGLIGRAHNVVRHPDMPRAVFQLLWDGIGAGQSIAAYVKNRTKDGGHYWVMASVAPVEGGYLSVRLKPTTPLFDAARRIYAELRPLELAIESGEGKARKRAIEASTARLGELLAAAGYGSYRAFMHEALAAEMAARESVCDRTRAAPRAGDPELEAVLAAATAVHDLLDGLFANLARYTELNRSLVSKAGFVGDLAGSVRMFSLNALIAATRLGDRGAALSAVADLMGQGSGRVGALLGGLDGDIAAAVELRLDDRLAAIAGGAGSLDTELRFLRALQINGRVEAAHLDDAGAVESLFAQIRARLEDAAVETDEFTGLATGGASRGSAAHELRGRLDELAGVAERVG